MNTIMKQIAGLLLVGVMMNCFCACEDKAENVIDAPEVESKYTGAEEAGNVVDELYRIGVPTFYGKNTLTEGPVAGLGGFLSGFFDNESEKKSSVCELCRNLTMDAVNIAPTVEMIWEDAYQAIYKANVAIDNIPRTKELTEEERRVLVSEASFFRAFNYFYLVRCFGEVPLVRSSEVDSEAAMLPRANVGEVYRLIVNDLQVSIANLPDSAFTENNFKVGRTAAETLLADVYLTMSGYPLRQSHFKDAANMARRVINGGKHLLAPNGATEEESAYNVLRTEDSHPEYVYTYRIDERNMDAALMAFSMPEAAKEWNVLKVSGTNRTYMPTREYLNVYDSVYDLRMHEQQFFHSFYKYERKGKTIIQTFSQAPYWWFDRNGLQETGVSDKDIPVYRYAEVLLIAAEAIANAEGVTPEAVNYLAEVRARAYNGMTKAEICAGLSALNKERFVEEVWLERMREFPFEMKIWADMQRTRKYPVTSEIEKGTAAFMNIIGTANPWGAVFEEKHLLLPLSENILSGNPLWKQNPGYGER